MFEVEKLNIFLNCSPCINLHEIKKKLNMLNRIKVIAVITSSTGKLSIL